jgi:quercetin dioxygenase-like cupin family protein
MEKQVEAFCFRKFGKIDVSGFKKILQEADLDWDKFDFRQKRGETHKETKCIPIIFDESFSLSKFTLTENYPIFKEEILKLEKYLLESINEDGYIFRAILVNLPAGKSIPPHKDSGTSLIVPRRIHIAVDTNEDCFFTVGKITKNMKEGEIWEINNDKRRHSVENNGATDRIHLIVDFLKKK